MISKCGLRAALEEAEAYVAAGGVIYSSGYGKYCSPEPEGGWFTNPDELILTLDMALALRKQNREARSQLSKSAYDVSEVVRLRKCRRAFV